MSKYKVGDKVVIRKDLKVDEVYSSWFWNTEKEYMKEKDYVVIEGVDNDGHYVVENGGWGITDQMIEGLYKDVEKVKITKKQRIEKLESDYKLLNEEHAKLLDTVVKLTEKVNELTNPTLVKTVEKPAIELTPNKKRKQIIDEAKAFVKEMELEDIKLPLHYIIDFVDRTVSVYTDVNLNLSTVKCLPTDVFNVHIGKALAVAKRYEMYDEFEKFSNAIRPTEKVEGMKVKRCYSGEIVTLTCVRDIGHEKMRTSYIYDDSNAKY